MVFGIVDGIDPLRSGDRALSKPSTRSVMLSGITDGVWHHGWYRPASLGRQGTIKSLYSIIDTRG